MCNFFLLSKWRPNLDISNFLTLEIHNNSIECVCVFLVEMLFPLMSLGVYAAGLLFISDVEVSRGIKERLIV